MKQKQRFVELPETWQELTQADWTGLLKIRQQVADHGGRYTGLDILTETARLLLENRGVFLQMDNPNYIQLVAQYAKSLAWLWHVDESTVSLTYRNTRNLLPQIGCLHGPADHGSDLLFGEFRQAVAIMRQYEREPANDRHLKVLAGLLYRPMDGHKRQRYDHDGFAAMEARGAQMKPWQRWGVYAWFSWMCEYLTVGTFVIDGDEVCFAPLFTHDGQQQRDNDATGGMQAIALTLAETGVFGTADGVDHTPLLSVMLKLLMDKQRMDSIRKK